MTEVAGTTRDAVAEDARGRGGAGPPRRHGGAAGDHGEDRAARGRGGAAGGRRRRPPPRGPGSGWRGAGAGQPSGRSARCSTWRRRPICRGSAGDGELRVSARTGEGLAALRREIGARLAAGAGRASSARFPGSGRRCCGPRPRSTASGRTAPGRDRGGERCGRALHALGEITGETATEELLDRIFSTFCVGK